MKKANSNRTRSQDAELLAKFVKKQDEVAFAQLVKKYENLVWIVCFRVLNHQSDAEDAFQGTFLVLASKAKKIRKPRSIASWLYGVAFRTANVIRKQRHREFAALEETIDGRLPLDVLEEVATKNDMDLVTAELSRLPERYRNPLVRYYFAGQSVREIADEFDLSVAAVESQLRRGRQALRHRLIRRGIRSELAMALLIALPTVSIVKTLSSKTIACCLTTGVAGGWMASLATTFHSIKHTGVKSMIWKTTVAFGLAAVFGAGIVMHSGAFAHSDSANEVAYYAQGDFEPLLEANLNSGLQDQEQEEGEKKHDERLRRHHEELHKRVHEHAMQIMMHLHMMLHGGSQGESHSGSHGEGKSEGEGKSHRAHGSHAEKGTEKSELSDSERLHRHRLHQHHRHLLHKEKSDSKNGGTIR